MSAEIETLRYTIILDFDLTTIETSRPFRVDHGSVQSAHKSASNLGYSLDGSRIKT